MAFKTPKQLFIAVSNTAVGKSRQVWTHTLLLGFLAGVFISLGGLLSLTVGGQMGGTKSTDPGMQKFIFGLVFPYGLMIVLLAGAELATGNVSVMIVGVMTNKVKMSDLWRNWGLSYFGNFIGSVFTAYFFVYLPGLVDDSNGVAAAAANIASAKIHGLNWGQYFLRGIACNWLVCLAVWMAMAGEDFAGKILAMWPPITAFVTIGYEHSVANMFLVTLGLMVKGDTVANGTFGEFIGLNLVPVTLGNIVGGGVFVAGAYYHTYYEFVEESKLKSKEMNIAKDKAVIASRTPRAAGAPSSPQPGAKEMTVVTHDVPVAV
jgi:formate/nitrite transporter